MKTLFIGHGYTDVTFITDYIPTGDEKYLGKDYAFGVGGNAIVAGFTLAKLGKNKGIGADMILPVAEDWLSKIILQKAAKAGISVYSRSVGRSSLSLILPNDEKRAIVRCRDTDYLETFPKLDISDYKAIHLDGHQPEAALHYAKLARKKGILTSLDGGSYEREGVDELLNYIDAPIVSERFCEQLGKSSEDTIEFLLAKGAKVAAVTLGTDGLIYQEDGGSLQSIPSITVDHDKVIDSTGAGDIFHGAYLYSWLSKPEYNWEQHFMFARAASALSVQKLGAEASIPTCKEILDLMEKNPA
jgi:sugar/nucleoside kinase (ribokinase family)